MQGVRAHSAYYSYEDERRKERERERERDRDREKAKLAAARAAQPAQVPAPPQDHCGSTKASWKRPCPLKPHGKSGASLSARVLEGAMPLGRCLAGRQDQWVLDEPI